MSESRRNPRILVVTPEIAWVPPGMERGLGVLTAKAGGMADVCAGLVTALFELGADVHVALPNYRRLFHVDVTKMANEALREYRHRLPGDRIHLAEDSIFYNRTAIYGRGGAEVPKLSLRFQREVINNVLPAVQPDLIHCNDWMTGLIPAMARRLGIPCLLTVHNIHTYELVLPEVEDSGIDVAEFWLYLYYTQMPGTYEQTRQFNRVDLLASGIFASHYVNTVSPTFLDEIVAGLHDSVPHSVRQQIRFKREAGCATGILNAPPAQYRPFSDELIPYHYSASDHASAKRKNKRALQEELGLRPDGRAPLLFWPSRLDPAQKGCDLFAAVLLDVLMAYAEDGLQVAVVADGAYQAHLREIAEVHGLHDRVAVTDFDERISRMGYAASDFTLVPSKFEPCGLPQMIGAVYGSLPIVHDTGGLHDTIVHLQPAQNVGNGFVFRHHDANGLRWAIDQAMAFHRRPAPERETQVERVMAQSESAFNHTVMARHYFDLYEQMLNRPLIDPFRPQS